MPKLTPELARSIEAALGDQLSTLTSRREKTWLVAQALFFGHGIHPSANTVKKFTLHGSMGDIQADLDAFWDSLRDRFEPKVVSKALPDEITAKFVSGLEAVWSLAGEKAQAAFEDHQRKADEKVARADARVREADALKDAAEARGRELEAQLAAEVARREAAEGRVEALTGEAAQLRVAIEDWKQAAEAEKKARQAAEMQFSRDLADERAARLRDNEAHEEARKFALAEVDAARQEAKRLKGALDAERQSREMEVEAQRGKVVKAERELAAANQAIAGLSGRNEILERRVRELESSNREHETASREAAERAGQIEMLERQVRELNEQLRNAGQERRTPKIPAARAPRRWRRG